MTYFNFPTFLLKKKNKYRDVKYHVVQLQQFIIFLKCSSEKLCLEKKYEKIWGPA